MKGRKPKPRAILTLDGSRRKRPDEPTVPAGDAEFPAELAPHPRPCAACRAAGKSMPSDDCAECTGNSDHFLFARAEWDRVAPVLTEMGVLTQADQTILAAYCLAWGRLLTAEREIAKTGAVVKSPSGYPIQNPWLSVSNRAGKDMKGYAEQLGLSPVARARVKAAPPAKANKFEQFMGKKRSS